MRRLHQTDRLIMPLTRDHGADEQRRAGEGDAARALDIDAEVPGLFVAETGGRSAAARCAASTTKLTATYSATTPTSL